MATHPDIQNDTAVVPDFERMMDEFILLTLLLNHFVLRGGWTVRSVLGLGRYPLTEIFIHLKKKNKEKI